ncbi:MAG: methylmalonyl Co-A mutase-associated GTPase MeaB [Phycisphaerales bacterium]|nr:methylmalonyl Co-A mutase-associated GTPase MeaB [Phycisphaerales bacterium]
MAIRPGAPPPRVEPTAVQLVRGVRSRDRAALGRAISLIESSNPAHQSKARELMRLLAVSAPDASTSIRIGITGVPGAGKSTFIERLGCMLTSAGSRLAVLAVDPSSAISGGAILGDKTRMAKLASDPNAFIRPSPSSGTLGGVARTTRDSIAICEAAGFDVVLVETVGVGQSETAVADMTDLFLALMVPGAGDELQGIKRGLLELVDILIVNKCDGDNMQRAKLAARQHAGALRMLRGDGESALAPIVLTASALTGDGVADIWTSILARHSTMRSTGNLEARRRTQRVRWLDTAIDDRLHAMLRASSAAQLALENARARVLAGTLAPSDAADTVLNTLIETICTQRPQDSHSLP